MSSSLSNLETHILQKECQEVLEDDGLGEILGEILYKQENFLENMDLFKINKYKKYQHQYQKLFNKKIKIKYKI
jgi:hypothetical protein